MPYGGQVLDSDGIIQEVSSRSCELLGYSQEELIGHHFTKLLSDQDTSHYASNIQHVLNHQTIKIEVQLKHKDGTQIPVLRSARLIADDGKGVRILAIDMEITDLRNTQDALAKSEENFRIYFEHANDAIALVDEYGIIVAWNRQSELLTGRSAEDIIGLPVWDAHISLLPPDQRNPETIARIKRKTLEALETGVSAWPSGKAILQIRHSKGAIKTIEQSIILIETPKGYRISVASWDISELVEEREKSAELLTLLKDSQEVAKIGSLYYDLSEDHWTCTEVIYSMLELPSDHSRNIEGWISQIVPGHRQKFIDFIDQLPTQGEDVFEMKYKMRRASDNAVIWVKHTGYCEKDGAGHTLSFTSTVQDITEPKLQSESLRRSEASLRTSQQLARLGTFVADLRSSNFQVNSIFAEIAGIDNSVPMTYPDWLNLIHPDDLARMELKRKYKENQTINEDFRVIRENDGQIRWVHGLTEYQYDNEGKIEKISGTIQDITDRILGQKKLEESERLLQISQQVGKLGSYTVHFKTKEWTSTPVMDEIFGLPDGYKKDIENWKRLIVATDLKMLAQHYSESVIKQGGSFDKTYRIKRYNDGKIRWVRGRGVLERDETGTPVRMHGTIQDVTQQKESEAILRKLSFALQQSPASTVITDTAGNIEYVNAKFMEITGYSQEEVMGENPRILSSGERSGAEYKKLWDSVLAGGVWQGEFHNKRKNGDLYWEWAVISPIRDETGTITQLLAVKEDITQRKLDEEKQKSLQEQLNRAQRMEAIGTLAGGIAHDFNNILQSMYLYLGMAQDALPDGYVKEDIQQVSKAANRAKELVGQILTYSRQGEIKKSNVLIQFVIKEAIKFLKSSFPVSVKLKEDINTECWPVYCDPTHIHQIFINICSNAFDSLPQHMGTINIHLDMVEIKNSADSGITVSPGTYVELRVADTGAGIPASILPKIFNPFFSTKAPGMGSGLGLSVALGIMEEMGGQILVESEQEVGSTFRLLFPAVPTQDVAEPDVSQIAFKFDELSLILIISEDNIRKGTQRTLEKLGCHVVSCNTGQEVMDLLQKYPDTFSLILADQDLVEMTGVHLAELVKSNHPAISCILMTSSNFDELTMLPESGNIDGVLKKPWRTGDLLTKISEILTSA